MSTFQGTVYADRFVAAGVPVVPGNIPLHSGTYRWVNSSTATASNNNDGTDKAFPCATIAGAIAKCTANADDVILVGSGHAEAVTASSLNLSVAGVSVYCLGQGLKKPTFTYGAADSTITVSAANCKWVGGYFIGNFDNVAAAFTLGACKDFELNGGEFTDTSAILHFLSIVVTGATNNACDGLKIIGNRWLGLAVAPDAMISILGDINRIIIHNNFADMAATNDVGHFLTITADTLLRAEITHNKLIVTGATNATVGIFLTGSSTDNTGFVAYNLVASLDTTTELISTASTQLRFFENYYTGTADASGKLWPVVDAA